MTPSDLARLAGDVQRWQTLNAPGIKAGGGDVCAADCIIRLLVAILDELRQLPRGATP